MPSSKRAISTISSTLLFIISILIVWVLLCNLVWPSIENFTKESSTPYILSIGKVEFNQTCITIHVLNSGERDATIEKVYINKEPKAFNLLDHDPKIKANTDKEIYIFGSYVAGCKFDIRVTFESGYSLYSLEKY